MQFLRNSYNLTHKFGKAFDKKQKAFPKLKLEFQKTHQFKNQKFHMNLNQKYQNLQIISGDLIKKQINLSNHYNNNISLFKNAQFNKKLTINKTQSNQIQKILLTNNNLNSKLNQQIAIQKISNYLNKSNSSIKFTKNLASLQTLSHAKKPSSLISSKYQQFKKYLQTNADSKQLLKQLSALLCIQSVNFNHSMENLYEVYKYQNPQQINQILNLNTVQNYNQGEKYTKKNENQVEEDEDFIDEDQIDEPAAKEEKDFSLLQGFPDFIQQNFEKSGFISPTDIQAKSWPILSQRKDLISIAKTGSGKTIAYLFPAISQIQIQNKPVQNYPRQNYRDQGYGHRHHKYQYSNNRGHYVSLKDKQQYGPQILILAPTRELVKQIEREAQIYTRNSGIKVISIYGGTKRFMQAKDLKQLPEILIATPGRLLDFLESQDVFLSNVSQLVFDEADQMLQMGFEEQINDIMKHVPEQRQTSMWTATWPENVQKLAYNYLKNPVIIRDQLQRDFQVNSNILQNIEVLPQNKKKERLVQILKMDDIADQKQKVLIFGKTKEETDKISDFLLTNQIYNEVIHGDKSQNQRERIMARFRKGYNNILVSTNLTSRGLDIKDVKYIINFDFPQNFEDYIHRIGRTGRGFSKGIAYTFFVENDIKYTNKLIKTLQESKQAIPQGLQALQQQMARISHFKMGSRRSKYGRRHSYDQREPRIDKIFFEKEYQIWQKKHGFTNSQVNLDLTEPAEEQAELLREQEQFTSHQGDVRDRDFSEDHERYKQHRSFRQNQNRQRSSSRDFNHRSKSQNRFRQNKY